MPAALICLLADQAVGHDAFDVVLPAGAVDPQYGQVKQSKLNKVDAILTMSDERILYVDNDTYFAADVSHVFDQAREFDLAFVQDTWQFADIYRKLNHGLPDRDPPPGEPFINCGVLFVRRNPATDAFLRVWQAGYRADPRLSLDQLVFREQVYRSDLRLHVLPATFNARIGEPCHMSGLIRIAHAYPRAHGDAGVLGLEPVTSFLNSTICNRIYLPELGRISWIDQDFGIHERYIHGEARPTTSVANPDVVKL